ncbi:YdeI/OmpD-associated family protein [Lacticaseibacillus jixiensis]|uniref:YdeI/OmpD-associated family protein n=1 Tax=Lacticaseibacillus jixiensis TaxID=3231926 RepID=UPI0036F1CD18
MPNLQQLGFLNYHRVVITGMPEALQPVLAALPYTTTPQADCDLRVVFALNLAQLKKALSPLVQDQLRKAKAMVYVLYPAITSPHYRGIAPHQMLEALDVAKTTGAIGTTGFKLTRMRQFNDDFMLLDVQPASANTTLRIANYDARVPELHERLKHKTPQLAATFAQLTPHQQRDWARYIFSPKRPVTQNSHFDQMQLVLQAGFATLEQYRKGQS